MTNAGTRTWQEFRDNSAEDDAKGPCFTGDPVAYVTGRDGRDYPVWKTPHDQKVSNLIAGSRHEQGSLRAMLTEHDLYLWQSVHVPHGDFARQTGVDGVRVRLAPNIIAVNQETIGIPSEYPWIFGHSGDLMDVERRREIVERWLKANSRLAVIYPRGFTVNWYM